MKKSTVLFLIVVNLTACTTIINIPNTVKSPTTLGNNTFDISGIGGGAPSIPLKDKDTITVDDIGFVPIAGFKFGYGLTDKMDIEAETSAPILIGALHYISLGINYQWLGNPVYKTKQGDWTSTTQLKAILGIKDKANSKIIKSPMGFSLSNTAGYMIYDWLTVYGGGQATYIFAEFKIKKQEQGTAKKIDSHILSYGPFAGIRFKLFDLDTTNSPWKIIFSLEGNLTNVPLSIGFDKRKNRHWMPGFIGSSSVLLQF